jgi:hypothetical protein
MILIFLYVIHKKISLYLYYFLSIQIELHDGQSAVVSVAYGSGSRPPYLKEERRKLVTIRQNTTDNNEHEQSLK